MNKEENVASTESKLFQRRGFIIQSIFIVSFLGIGARLWQLQIKEGAYYKNLSNGNRIRLISVGGVRGIITDRNGVILSKNIPSFDLVVVPEDCHNIPKIVKKSSQLLGIPYDGMMNKIKFNKEKAKFIPITIHNNLNWRQISVVSAYQEEFSGISIQYNPIRHYPHNNTFSHALGYMSKINLEMLSKINKKKKQSSQYIGSDGVERAYNSVLTGYDGGIQAEVDNVGRIINQKKAIAPIPGKNIKLTIDANLQLGIETIFGNRVGAVIAMNPNNGEVLAMFSKPNFNPNDFSTILTPERWKQLVESPGKVLNNRCIQNAYPPGSTFKLLIALIALEEGLIGARYTYNCKGYYRLHNAIHRCWKHYGHGEINLVTALEQSCNTFFYQLGNEIGIQKIYEYGKKIGLDRKTNIDLVNEKSGVLPNKKWKRLVKKSIWYPGETLSVSIGQGYVTTTPLQLINYFNIFINGGNLIKPRIVKSISEKTENTSQIDGIEYKNLGFAKENLEIIKRGLEKSVINGTSKSAYDDTIPIGGKTGTTQIISTKTKKRIIESGKSISKELENHAWFLGYAPVNNPEVSVCVFIENGKSSYFAASLAKEIFSLYFNKNDKTLNT